MTTTKADFDFAALDGRWHVVHSTLKLWKTGGRTNPSITYTYVLFQNYDILGSKLFEQMSTYFHPFCSLTFHRERKTEPNGTAVWRDEVNYLVPKGSGYKAKSIVGWDRQKSKGSSYFVWRGVGMLCWVTCPCDVLFMQDDWVRELLRKWYLRPLSCS